MISLVTGGSKCGRSRYAESLLKTADSKIYLATMQPFGEEAYRTIERHRRLRENKGFTTVERYTDLETLAVPRCDGILLECIANLLANEMFSETPADDVTGKIMKGISHLAVQTGHLVVVTSQVGADGITYSPETMSYIENMGRLNSLLAEIADNVTECVYGIPVTLKGERIC